jgi:hypothetical protein
VAPMDGRHEFLPRYPTNTKLSNNTTKYFIKRIYNSIDIRLADN